MDLKIDQLFITDNEKNHTTILCYSNDLWVEFRGYRKRQEENGKWERKAKRSPHGWIIEWNVTVAHWKILANERVNPKNVTFAVEQLLRGHYPVRSRSSRTEFCLLDFYWILVSKETWFFTMSWNLTGQVVWLFPSQTNRRIPRFLLDCNMLC